MSKMPDMVFWGMASEKGQRYTMFVSNTGNGEPLKGVNLDRPGWAGRGTRAREASYTTTLFKRGEEISGDGRGERWQKQGRGSIAFGIRPLWLHRDVFQGYSVDMKFLQWSGWKLQKRAMEE